MRAAFIVLGALFSGISAASADEGCVAAQTPLLQHPGIVEAAKGADGKLVGLWEGGTWQSTGMCTAVAFLPKAPGEVTIIYAWGNNPNGKAGTTVDAVKLDGDKTKYRPSPSRELTFELQPDGTLSGKMTISGRGTYTSVFTRIPDDRLK